MASVNSVILEGNLTRDGELTYTASGVACLKLGLAYNRSYLDKGEWVKKVSYFEVVAWHELATRLQQYCTKGKGVRVVGRIEQDRWTGKDGKTNSAVKIVAEHIEVKPSYQKNEVKPQTNKAIQDELELEETIPF